MPQPFSSTSVTTPEDRQLQELFEKLHAASGRDARFLGALIEAQRRILDGRFGATFVVERGRPPRVVAASPAPGGGRLTLEPARLQMLRGCVDRCVRGGEQFHCRLQEGEHEWHAVCTPLVRRQAVEGVCIVLTDAHDPAATQARMAQARWLCQLYPGHVAKRMLGRHTRQLGQSRMALGVLGAVRDASRFEACCMNACNQLKTQMRAQRVCLSWVHGNSVRLLAMSDTEHLDRRQEPNRCLESAMEECFDQCQPVLAQTESLQQDDSQLSRAVCRCHSELSSLGGHVAVCSVVLRHGDRALGVITVELPPPRKFTARSVDNLQAVADLITPTLADRHTAQRPVAVKAWGLMRRAAGVLVGSQHVGVKLSVLAVSGVLVYACLATWEYRIGAPFAFDASSRRIYSAYFDSTIEHVGARRGDAVKAGQVLARLDAGEIQMDLKKIDAQISEQRTVHRLAMRDGLNAEARRTVARLRRHETERDRLEFLASRATVTASEAGVVLQGDWPQRIGERIERGQPLFEVAPLEHLRAVIHVDESQIDRVQVGSRGQLATRAEPEQVFGFTVERIVPVGEPLQGSNVFQVHARLDVRAAWMRPGMSGTARINTGRESVAWIATHKLVDFLRLKLWM